MNLDESRAEMSEPFRIHKPLARNNSSKSEVQILCLNIKCLSAHINELSAYLFVHRPHIVLIQETWLDDSVKSVNVLGYETVSRRDRKATENRGGVLILQRGDFNALILIENRKTEERNWHFLRLDSETVLLANWYRPGASTIGFDNLQSEISRHYEGSTGVLVARDLNIHRKKK